MGCLGDIPNFPSSHSPGELNPLIILFSDSRCLIFYFRNGIRMSTFWMRIWFKKNLQFLTFCFTQHLKEQGVMMFDILNNKTFSSKYLWLRHILIGKYLSVFIAQYFYNDWHKLKTYLQSNLNQKYSEKTSLSVIYFWLWARM